MSARGVTRYDLHAARPYDEIVTAAAEDALNGPTSPAGIVRLADVHAALAVQQALLAGWVDDPDPAEDALDLFLARTLDQPSGDPFLISFACAEFGRTGADEPLDATARWLRDQQAPIPGLGMAVSQASLLRVLRGFEVQPLIDWLIGLGPADLSRADRRGRPPRAARDRGAPRRAGAETTSAWRPRSWWAVGWAPV